MKTKSAATDNGHDVAFGALSGLMRMDKVIVESPSRRKFLGAGSAQRLNLDASSTKKIPEEERSKESGESIDHIVTSTLSRCLDVPFHTLFQISTSGALVQGIYKRAVSSTYLLNYGDFGLGTFDNLDGEWLCWKEPSIRCAATAS